MEIPATINIFHQIDSPRRDWLKDEPCIRFWMLIFSFTSWRTYRGESFEGLIHSVSWFDFEWWRIILLERRSNPHELDNLLEYNHISFCWSLRTILWIEPVLNYWCYTGYSLTVGSTGRKVWAYPFNPSIPIMTGHFKVDSYWVISEKRELKPLAVWEIPNSLKKCSIGLKQWQPDVNDIQHRYQPEGVCSWAEPPYMIDWG